MFTTYETMLLKLSIIETPLERRNPSQKWLSMVVKRTLEVEKSIRNGESPNFKYPLSNVHLESDAHIMKDLNHFKGKGDSSKCHSKVHTLKAEIETNNLLY